MVFKTKSIAQLNKEIADQKNKIGKQQLSSKKTAETIKLQRQLFELKNRRLIEAGKKAKRLSGKFGRSLLRAGKKAAPVVKKQFKLIRQQQLRDDALARKLSKRTKPKTQKKSKGFNPLGNLDF